MGSLGWAFAWSFWGLAAFEWIFFFFGFVSVKFYLAWFEICRVWSFTMLPANAIYLFAVSTYVEYMNGWEIMFAAINAFLVVPAVATIHQANFKKLRFLAYGKEEEEEKQREKDYDEFCQAGNDASLGYFCDEDDIATIVEEAF